MSRLTPNVISIAKARAVLRSVSLAALAVTVCIACACTRAAHAAPLSARHAPPIWSPNQVVAPSAQSVTNTLLRLNAQRRRAQAHEQITLTQRVMEVAALRRQLLEALIDDEPQTVLRAALSARSRAALPPAAQALLEQETEAEGTLTMMVEDRDSGHRYRYSLATGGEHYTLHFAEPPPLMQTGSWVRVKGVRVNHALALQSADNVSVEALPAVAPNTFGEQRTAVILVNFQDNPIQPYTPAFAQSVVFSTTSNFDMEGSYQQTWLSGDVYGWYTIPLSSAVCDNGQVALQAQAAAAAAGVNLSAYARLVYAFPQNVCGWWGLGTVGGTPSEAWINGSLQLRVVGHEMGHNLGLLHSHALECGSTTLGTNCSTIEYGDTVDIMGGTATHYNAFQKERLGWLNYGVSPSIVTVATDGTYAIDALEMRSANPVALKVLKSTDPTTGAKTWYYIEYRRPLGFDSILSGNSNVITGVVIHTGSEASGDSSFLLDMTPATPSWSDPALAVGQTYFDPDAQVTISTVSTSASTAVVAVSVGVPACVRATPAIDVAMQPGTAQPYTVMVTNHDSPNCGASNFNLTVAVPNGWTATFNSPLLNVSPGTSASTGVQLTSSNPTASGFVEIQVTATNATAASYSASSVAAYAVEMLLDVHPSWERTPFGRLPSLIVETNGKMSNAPLRNMRVTITIAKPNGGAVVRKIFTRADGTGVVRYRIRRSDGAGLYTVTASATRNGGADVVATSTIVLD